MGNNNFKIYEGYNMKLIQREEYLEKLINVINTPDIKVITGVRRSGKSKLLELFLEYLKNKDNNANIIHINFNYLEFEYLNEYHELENYIENHYISNKNNYVIIDEIELCKGFEKAINSLHAKEKYDIYITGSNAFLLSSDLATLFTGRIIEIQVFPFSFKEYKQYYDLKDNYPAFDSYMKDGGMSGSYFYLDDKSKFDYIANIYKTLIIRDIKIKYKIKKSIILDRISEFLLDNISNVSSFRNIANALISNSDEISHKTVGNYINYLCNAFLFYKVKLYDIRGKKYLSNKDKYYLVDPSFKYGILGSKNFDAGRIIENIVALELLRRGYEVYVGVLYKSEIDFVAIKRSEKLYIQVADDITNVNTFNREVTSLLKIKDAYPKILIARTRSDTYIYEGIKVIDIASFLTE